ncbi:TonB-dependent receptor [Novosphingobium terrae]|uniref:TonB-dependent receptor n=1 Tax=Novosphingobium terrae TaxID=2726189 RepID=UPI001982034E|nr:TonB-dependent receptor [Novosphingobium terrae]
MRFAQRVLRGKVEIGLLLAGACFPAIALAATENPAKAAATPAAEDDEAPGGQAIVVNGQREKEDRPSPTALSVSPSAGIAAVYTLNQNDIAGLVVTTANDLLRSIPGVEVANLGNGGIPNGVTIRGWGYVSDGTAVRGVIDGATNNFNSSGPNANGSDDLNILIPEIIGAINVIKGPFDTRYSGNYAYAGTAIFSTADSAPNRVALSAASFSKERIVATLGNGQEPGRSKYYIAVEASSDGGYRQNNSEDKVNIFTKLTTHLSAKDTLKLTGQIYNDVFGQPGYIRTDLVQQGLISEKSATDNNTKGWRHSQGATLEWQHRDAVINWDLNANIQHINQYRSIERYSIPDINNNPYPENAFHDKRWTAALGFNPWVNFRIAGIDAIFRAGADLRGDFVNTVRAPAFNNQFVAQPTAYDAWTSFFNYTNGNIWNPDLYGELSLKPASWIKITGGVRDDWFNYNANDTVYSGTATGVTATTVPGPPTITPASLATYRFNGWSDQPTLHGGIAIGSFAGFTLLGNFGEGITSQWLNQVTAKGGVNYPTLSLNPTLAPTKLNTKEVVLKYDNDRLGLNVEGGYYSTLNQGEIGSDPATGNPVNLGKSVRKGWDIDARLRLYDRNGTSLKIGGNYNQVSAKLRGSGWFVAGTPPWTAGWNLDAATPVGPEGQKVRLSIQHSFVGGSYLTNGPATIVTSSSPLTGNTYGTGVLRNGELDRLSFKLQYERPRLRNLRVYFSGVVYTGDRFAEMTTTSVGFWTTANTLKGATYRVGNAQAPFRAEGGVSIDF